MRILSALSMLLVSAFCLAQDGPPAKEILLSQRIFMVFMPEVKKELKIDDPQLEKIKVAFGESLRVEGEQIMIMMTGQEDFAQMQKDAAKALKPEQAKRLKELWIQSLNGIALADDEVAKDLSLTSSQKEEVNKIVLSAGEAIHELMSGGMIDQEGAKQIEKLRKQAGEKMLKLLDAEQSKTYETLKGKEFKFKGRGH